MSRDDSGLGDYWTVENPSDLDSAFTVLGIRIDPRWDDERYEEACLDAGLAMIEYDIKPIEQHLAVLRRDANQMQHDWCDRLIQWLFRNDEEKESELK